LTLNSTIIINYFNSKNYFYLYYSLKALSKDSNNLDSYYSNFLKNSSFNSPIIHYSIQKYYYILNSFSLYYTHLCHYFNITIFIIIIKYSQNSILLQHFPKKKVSHSLISPPIIIPPKLLSFINNSNSKNCYYLYSINSPKILPFPIKSRSKSINFSTKITHFLTKYTQILNSIISVPKSKSHFPSILPQIKPSLIDSLTHSASHQKLKKPFLTSYNLYFNYLAL
jgi:hypothetical protein